MSLLWIAESFYVGVRHLASSTSWYIEKLGLKETDVELDEDVGCIALAFPKEAPTTIVLGPLKPATDTTTRMLYSGALEKAHGWLNSRGVSVGPILTDRQGTRYFAMQDLEGNPLEVSEEP